MANLAALPVILIADNDREHLERYCNWLNDANAYEVLDVGTLDSARTILRDHSLDLAVIDIRMTNDEDELDESGLYFALETAEIGIPTLILTSYPSYEFVRRAQTRFPDGTPSHINFIGKQEAKDVFLRVVQGSLRNRNVFIVHGHNRAAKYEVKAFMQELGLKPILLEEMPNLGKTIIEKLEHYSNVGYVIVIMSADDIGGIGTTPPGELHPRARQNVVFELGYFMAKRGRRRVCLLLEQDVPKEPIEIFSDIYGIVYISMHESGNWREQIVKELKLAGFKIDWP